KGTIYQHNYPTLVDKDTFEKCQKVRTRMKNEHPKFIDKPFVFKRILECATCGCRITSEIQKGKYIYLFCAHFRGNCNQERIREEIPLQQV
ncbi:MAG: zinc ribbon domain-containing protein, partial [Endomicrobium sp.]|nr:zinc ribbon domain-containing protein [Endomicrobium sp.]